MKPETVADAFQVIDARMTLLVAANGGGMLNRVAGRAANSAGKAAPCGPPVFHRMRSVKVAMLARRKDEMLLLRGCLLFQRGPVVPSGKRAHRRFFEPLRGTTAEKGCPVSAACEALKLALIFRIF